LLIRLEELEDWKRKLRVGLPEADVGKRIEELLKELAAGAEEPGFRKGKVPRNMVERKYGEKVKVEAIESLMGDAYVAAIKEAGIHPICDPIVDSVEHVPTDGHYHFTATVEVRPEIELKDYQGLSFTERVPVVSNEDVERALAEVREGHADLTSVPRPSIEGDFVVVDYDRLDEDGKPVAEAKVKDYPCEVGKGQIPPELDKGLLGVSAGDGKTIAISYPDDYGVEALAGKAVQLAVTVKDVMEKRLPPLDDTLASKVGKFETLLDLRVGIRNSLEAEAKNWARQRLEEEIVRTFIEKNPFVLPECLVEERLERMYERVSKSRRPGEKEIDREQFREVYRPVVEQQVRSGLILGTLAKEHGIDVAAEEMQARIAAIAEQQGKKPEQLLEDLKGTDALSQIENDIWLEKVHDLIVGFSKITTEPFEPPKPGEGEEAAVEQSGSPK